MLKLDNDKIKDIILNNKDKIILRNNNIPEINLELALIILDEVYNQLHSQNYIIAEDIQTTVLSENYLVMKFILEIYNSDSKLIARYVEVGEAKENNDLIARFAYSRAIKRLTEKIIGIRLINKILLELRDRNELIDANNNVNYETKNNNVNVNIQPQQLVEHVISKPITEKQIQLIFEMAKERNKLNELVKIIKNTFNKTDIKELTVREASELIEILKQR